MGVPDGWVQVIRGPRPRSVQCRASQQSRCGRPIPLVDVRPQGKVEQHADSGSCTAGGGPVVLHFFDTFRPVVAEQVFEVPKIMLKEHNIPQRAALR